MQERKPKIALTMGDPAGIGPEIIVRALADHAFAKRYLTVVVGDPGIIAMAARIAGLGVSIFEYDGVPEEVPPGKIAIIPGSRLPLDTFRWGMGSGRSGKAAVDCLSIGVRLALEGVVDAVVTAPINKATVQKAGFVFRGHTEFIAELAGVDHPVMMLAGRSLRVALLTTHLPLTEAMRAVDRERIINTLRIINGSLIELFNLTRPRIAVAGLNPHAGEDGLFGSEEKEVIGPAVDMARSEGMEVEGPCPPDTVFHEAAQGHYDIVLSMYHDQGIIAVKTLEFGRAVNVTLGLPIIRASVDHGTAYEIAGKGIGDPSSMKEAIRLAALLARKRFLGGRAVD